MPLIIHTVNATIHHHDQMNVQNGKASSNAAFSGVSAAMNNPVKCSIFVTKGSFLGATSYPYVTAMIVAVAKLHIVKQSPCTNMQDR